MEQIVEEGFTEEQILDEQIINEHIIGVKNLSFRYLRADSESLKGINLTVEQGKFIVIMGRTGAGKTTLCLSLNGLIPQLIQGDYEGQVIVAGKDTLKYRVQDLAKEVGLVLQDVESQIVGRTVEEDIGFGPRNFGEPLDIVYEKTEKALKSVGLSGYNGRLTAELSGGEKQRLVMAGVLAIDPEILVLDEPTSELDPLGRLEVYKMLDDLCRNKNRTMIVVENSSEEIIQRADEIIVLNNGQIAWRGVPEALFRDINLLQEFGIKPLPVTLMGWELYQRGWIESKDIPLDVYSAESLVRRLLKNNGVKSVKADGYINTDSENVIEVNKLVHKYESGQMALKGINLTIKKGEFVALVGANGAGKTTLAKHFNGLLKPTQGEVMVMGMNTKDYDTAALARKIGYVFQNPDHQIFSVSVEKELEFGLKNAGFNPEECKERINRALELTGLEKLRKVHPYTLGKGERQLIAVASVLALTPEILIIDEPTTGLDWVGTQKILKLLQEINKQGSTIVMICHDMDVVVEYAKRVIVLQKGQIIQDASAWEALGNADLLKEASILPPQLCLLNQRLNDLGLKSSSAEEFKNVLYQAIEEACSSAS